MERCRNMSRANNTSGESAKQHGFCNAIFSAPVNFNKENNPPSFKASDTPTNVSGNTSRGSPTCKRNLINYLPINKSKEQVTSNNKNVGLKSYNRTPKSSNKNFVRSSSDITVSNQSQLSATSTKFPSDEKLKSSNKNTSNPRLSGDKTPVTHFCTPKNYHPRSASNSALKPKRYFSETTLPQTPDCYNPVHLETPRAKTENTMEEQTNAEGENSNLTVGIRVRPLSFKEQMEPKIMSIVDVSEQSVIVDCDTSQHTFSYDHCFISRNDPTARGSATQEAVFNTIALPLVQNAFEGYNVCLFAYGQTGSGKSYSMMGADLVQTDESEIHPGTGIIPRFCHEIFSRIALDHKNKTTVEISYFEIYNEKIHDLLISNSNGAKRAPLKVREHPTLGPYIVDLSQHIVQNYDDLKAWLRVGNSQRATAATGMNEKSSRSHSIFSIILTQTKESKAVANSKTGDASRRSKINLVDLAGSERLSSTGASGERLREGVSINKSLLTLGKVIGSLSEGTSEKRRNFVPYRESVLTWLLKESLGGNSRTAMLATISPANVHLEETLATLRYACQARSIVNRVRVNEDPHDRTIRQLRAEVQRLKNLQDDYQRRLGLSSNKLESSDTASDSSEEIVNKQREIDQLKDQLKKMEEQLFFNQNTIENKHGKLTFYPEKDGDNYVNGELVKGRVRLKHGDRLVIGGNHYFKVSNPEEQKDFKGSQDSITPIDFDYAYQEVLQIQEEKLRAELEESKQKAMKELENAKREVEMQLDSQKLQYEKEIEKLGSNLEEQKQALEDLNRKKMELEREKDLLASEIETNNKIRRIEIEDSGIAITPYRTNFLQELEEILNGTTANVHTALSIKTSMEAMKTGGISLHEIQLLVREATQTCREVGVNYEFHQQQIVVDKGLEPVIRVRDKDNMVESLWKPMRFLDWMHRLRDHELEHSIRELQDSNDKWEPFEDSDIVPDSLYDSRISVNITPVKRQLNESLSQFSVDASFLDDSLADKTTESIVQKRRDDMHQCIIQMELASKTLKGLCNQYESQDVSLKVSKALSKIGDTLKYIQDSLEEKRYDTVSSFNINGTVETTSASDSTGEQPDNNTSLHENSTSCRTSDMNSAVPSPTIKYFPDSNAPQPTKSNLRTGCPFLKNDDATGSTRSVRFDFK
ncbi:kinesin-like protein KIF14 isoform X2 [Trichogramma pretiosum]|uniref:kinesin-like protein KIF14 isoform X2 n=1 Tax=Trichogramma pretiosum TaxID=7493 RepID=UPI0006C97711|nr:kinesin-like protein KIF14 isoform X2 [Trichogramma pretiosum]